MKNILLGILAVLALLFLSVLIVIHGVNIRFRHEIEDHEQVNKDMAILRDRIKANPPDTNALNSMVQMLKANDSFRRTAAVAYLGQVGSRAEPAVNAIVETLEGNDGFAAREAARSLGEIGPSAQRAIPALIKSVQQHGNEDIGWFSAESLGNIADPNDVSVVAVLQQAAKSSDERMRDSAVTGLHILESRHAAH